LGKNSEILSFYYYWLLCGEMSTHLFTFGTFVLGVLGLLSLVTRAFTYSNTAIGALIATQIILAILAWFFRSMCEEKGSQLNVNLAKFW